MKKIIAVTIFCVVTLLLCSCGENSGKQEVTSAQKEDYMENIEEFSFTYGGYPGFIYEYNITIENDKIILRAGGMNGLGLNCEKEIEKEHLDAIRDIILENKIYKWNGFEEYDKNVCDGSGFKIHVKYKNGKELKADGFMMFPDSYNERIKYLEDYLWWLAKSGVSDYVQYFHDNRQWFTHLEEVAEFYPGFSVGYDRYGRVIDNFDDKGTPLNTGHEMHDFVKKIFEDGTVTAISFIYDEDERTTIVISLLRSDGEDCNSYIYYSDGMPKYPDEPVVYMDDYWKFYDGRN